MLEDSARTAVGVLSSAARWQSGHLLRAPGCGSASLRRPRSVLMRRTGHFLVGFEDWPTLFNIVGRSMLLTGNQAGIFPLFGAPLPSLCRPRGCGVRSRRGGQGSAALCGRL